MLEDGENRPRRGSETRKKTFPVTTRYDAAEFAELDDAASRAGLTRASFQRVQSLDTKPKTRSTRRAPVEKQMLAKVLGHLGKVGSNLNVIAHAVHLERATNGEAQKVLAEVRGLLPLLFVALGRQP